MSASRETVEFFDVAELARPNIRSLKPYTSARDTASEGLLLDANENPFDEEFEGVLLNRYPDPSQRLLRRRLADHLGVAPENLLAGSGSDEVLDWVLKVFCQPGVDRAAAASPSYGMYRVQADILGVDLWDAPLEEDFDFSADRFLASAPAEVKVLFLCSPNNPTGNLLSEGEALRLCRRWRGIVVLDEAYIEFADRGSLAAEAAKLPNLVVMRTFSKAWGRAGLRLGYAVASAPLIALFRHVKAPYNLGALTMAMGVRALDDPERLRRHIEEILSERRRIAAELAERPEVTRVFPSQANFALFRCRRALQVCQRLRERGVVVRYRGGMPRLEDCIRVSVGTRWQNDRFLEALGEALEETRR